MMNKSKKKFNIAIAGLGTVGCGLIKLLMKNKDLIETIFTEHDIAYAGDEGTMIIFPSSTWHKVNPQKSKKERITIAFNLFKYDRN